MTVAAPGLLEQGLDGLALQARAVREAAFGTRVTYSPKVFIPLTTLCRDRCGYCTFAQPPARAASPVPVARAGAGDRRSEGPRRAATRRSSPSASGPRSATRRRAPGWPSTATPPPSTTWRPCAGSSLDETGLLPHANAGALSEPELALLRGVSASQGMMLESLNPALAAHRGAPDKAPERRLATLEAAGRLAIPFTTGILVGIGESRPDRIEALEAIAAAHAPPRPRAGGDRPELPAQARHRDARRAAVPARGLPRGHRPGPADPAAGRPPAGAAQPLRRLRRAARRRHRRLGRRLARHRRPREPRATVAGARPAARGHRGPRARAGPAAHDLPRVRRATPARWLDERHALPGAGPRRRRVASAATTPGRPSPSGTRTRPTSGPAPRSSRSAAARRRGTPARTRRPPRWSPAARGRRGAVAEVLAGVRAGQEVGEDEIVTLFARPRPGGGGGGRGGRRGPRRGGRRRRRHLRPQPQHQLHERVHLQVPVLRLLQGPAVAQPARHAVPAHPRRHRRAGRGGVGPAAPPRCACRAASTPTSTATTTSTWPAR